MTHEKPELTQSAGGHPDSQEATVDQYFKDLLEASSLGSPAARRIRSMTDGHVVDEVWRKIERNGRAKEAELAGTSCAGMDHAGAAMNQEVAGTTGSPSTIQAWPKAADPAPSMEPSLLTAGRDTDLDITRDPATDSPGMAIGRIMEYQDLPSLGLSPDIEPELATSHAGPNAIVVLSTGAAMAVAPASSPGPASLERGNPGDEQWGSAHSGSNYSPEGIYIANPGVDLLPAITTVSPIESMMDALQGELHAVFRREPVTIALCGAPGSGKSAALAAALLSRTTSRSIDHRLDYITRSVRTIDPGWLDSKLWIQAEGLREEPWWTPAGALDYYGWHSSDLFNSRRSDLCAVPIDAFMERYDYAWRSSVAIASPRCIACLREANATKMRTPNAFYSLRREWDDVWLELIAKAINQYGIEAVGERLRLLCSAALRMGDSFKRSDGWRRTLLWDQPGSMAEHFSNTSYEVGYLARFSELLKLGHSADSQVSTELDFANSVLLYRRRRYRLSSSYGARRLLRLLKERLRSEPSDQVNCSKSASVSSARLPDPTFDTSDTGPPDAARPLAMRSTLGTLAAASRCFSAARRR